MSMETAPPTMIIGNYVVTLYPPLGKGGFSTVYRAEHKDRRHEQYALKQMDVIKNDIVNNQVYEIAKREVDVLSQLKHSNIVQCYEAAIVHNSVWISMELCSTDLTNHLKFYPYLQLDSRIKIMYETASGIAYMHNSNPQIIHRDIKLGNILMKQENGISVAKIADFGLSKITKNQSSSFTSAVNSNLKMNTPCGTEFFMPPECYGSKKDIQYDVSVDVFCLGAAFSVMLEYGLTHKHIVPLSVAQRASGGQHPEPIGQEMKNCSEQKLPIPTVVEYSSGDDKFMRRIKRIILNMTKLRRVERKNSQEVEEEFEELIEDLNQCRPTDDQMRQVTADNHTKDQEIARLHTNLQQLQASSNKKDQTIEQMQQQWQIAYTQTKQQIEQAAIEQRGNWNKYYSDALSARYEVKQGVGFYSSSHTAHQALGRDMFANENVHQDQASDIAGSLAYMVPRPRSAPDFSLQTSDFSPMTPMPGYPNQPSVPDLNLQTSDLNLQTSDVRLQSYDSNARYPN